MMNIMSRGRKQRTPAQLAVLAQAHEKAKIVIAERATLNALAKKNEAPQEPEPVAVSDEAPQPVPPEPEPLSESEDEEPRNLGDFALPLAQFRPPPFYSQFELSSPRAIFAKNPRDRGGRTHTQALPPHHRHLREVQRGRRRQTPRRQHQPRLDQVSPIGFVAHEILTHGQDPGRAREERGGTNHRHSTSS